MSSTILAPPYASRASPRSSASASGRDLGLAALALASSGCGRRSAPFLLKPQAQALLVGDLWHLFRGSGASVSTSENLHPKMRSRAGCQVQPLSAGALAASDGSWTKSAASCGDRKEDLPLSLLPSQETSGTSQLSSWLLTVHLQVYVAEEWRPTACLDNLD